MVGPRLDVDVLAIICEFLLDVSDVRSLTLTCSSVYPIAVRQILRMRPIYLRSGPSIYRFHSFLHADAPTRSPHVRAIHIDLMRPDDPAAQVDDLPFLLDILGTCNRIGHITLAFEEVSRLIAEDPRMIEAITSIPSLRSFSVLSSSTDALALLLQISTPLRALGIHCQNAFLSFWYPAALESFLPRVAGTLEKLEVAKFAVDPLVIQAGSHTSPSPIASLTKYPAVRSLSVKSFEGQPLLEDLQYFFPALDGTLSLGLLDIRCREETYDHIRAVNRRTQERNGHGSLSGTWKRLDRIVCSGPMLYILGLRCPIRLAMIDFGWSDKRGRYVGDALRANPVPRLTLTLEHDLGALDEVFSPELAETLTHLTLCLLYWNGHGSPPLEGEAGMATRTISPQFRWQDVLDGIVSAIRPLHRLTHLRVVISASFYANEDASPSFTPLDEYAWHSFRESMFDFDGAAATLSGAVPSLENVFVTTGAFLSSWVKPDLEASLGGCWKPYAKRWYVSRGWRVAIPGTGGVPEGGTRLVELHDEVADTIIRKEELVLEQDEKVLH